LFVLHRCDNRLCVNPDHLFLGTKQENSIDMARKGRHGRKKLSAEDIVAIRKDPRSHSVVAAEYGVTFGMIGMIRQRRCWAHVE